MYSQPLLVKLQKSTYRRYKEFWKRMLCFICRTMEPSCPFRLRHSLNAQQTALLDRLLGMATDQLRLQAIAIPQREAGSGSCSGIDDVCLDLCISLLDHELRRDLFESAVLGFLAVIGIDAKNSTFYEAQNYTPILLGFINIAQMLVVQKAVRSVERGPAEEPFSVVDELREHFMTTSSCTPFSWAVQLRSYGKRIRDSITSLGYI
jgi:hypothetical protein